MHEVWAGCQNVRGILPYLEIKKGTEFIYHKMWNDFFYALRGLGEHVKNKPTFLAGHSAKGGGGWPPAAKKCI